MNKKEYLAELKKILIDRDIKSDDIDDIIEDYDQMYKVAYNRRLNDTEVYNLLGDPNQIYHELKDTLNVKSSKKHSDKIIALTPFIAVITFMLLGLIGNYWHPTWLVFLIIPMSAIILNTHKKDKIVALSPFISLIIFMLVGTYTSYWNPAWLIFLSIPLLGLMYEKHTFKKYVQIGSLVLAIAFYLIMGYAYDNFLIGLYGFTLPGIVIVLFANINFLFGLKDPNQRKKGLLLLSVLLSAITLFVLFSTLLEDGWAFSWLVLLTIPMCSIFLYDTSRKYTPYMPFIAVIIFYTLGYFLGLFHISWIAFLLIPIVAVIENA